MSAGAALIRTIFFVALASAFGTWVWIELGANKGMEFFTAYILEWSLSMDNVFIMSVIFGALSIPREYRSRILWWGILTAMVLRAVFIFAGVALVAQFHWILILFGAFLVFTGIRMMFSDEKDDVDIEKNVTLKILRKYFRITKILHGKRFFIRTNYLGQNRFTEEKQTFVTPLFVALVMVEIADIMFAFDSVPAAFAVTTDGFIIYTANIFAIMGLRSLYFALEALVERFVHLDKALAVILTFIGAKVVVAEVFGVSLPIELSLGIVISLLILGVIASFVFPEREETNG